MCFSFSRKDKNLLEKLRKLAPMKENAQDYVYRQRLIVRDYECDIEGVVNNANYQHYLEYARHEFLRSIGIDFRECTANDYIFMVSRIEMRFKTPLHGGEQCDVCLNVRREGARYIFEQDIIRVSDGKLAVSAEVECVAIHEKRIAKETPYDDALTQYYS